MGYFKDTLKGVGWMGSFRLSYRIIGFVRLAIIARILSPYSLGVFGVATITLALIEMLTETGINVFLIQQKKPIEKYLNTAWAISIIRGILISLLIIIFVPAILLFFNSPDSKSLLFVVALVPLIRGFINPAIIKFQKDLFFNKEFAYKILVYLAETTASVVGVYFTRSPIGLVYGLLAGAVFEVLFTFVVAFPRPSFVFDYSKAKEIVARGKWVTLFGIFDYLYTQLDNIIVAKLLGVAPLGIYQNAYKISTAPLTEVGDVFFRVTFPIFSKISADKKRLAKAFIKNTVVNALLMTLGGIFIYSFADLIVKVLLGNQWSEAVPVVRLLSVLGVVRGIAGSTNSLIVATQNQKYSAIVMFVSALVLLLSIFPLVKAYGLTGAGMAAILGTLISLPFTIYFIHKTLK